MTAYINGAAVEGSLEEIAKLLGIKLDDSRYVITDSNTYKVSEIPCPPGYNPGFCCYDEDCNACREQWVKESWNLKGEHK